MLISIHDKDLRKVAFLDNEKPGTLHYFDDAWHRYLAEATSTFDFSVPKTGNSDLSFLTEQGYISFTYGQSQYLFSIMKIEETEKKTTCYCENLNLELLNETSPDYKSPGARNFVQYLTLLGIQYAQLEVGINEVSDLSRTLEWTGTETKLARLLSLVHKFDAECEFVTYLNRDGTLNRIVLNVYRKHGDNSQGVGARRNDTTLYYGKAVKEIRRTVDKTGLYTAIKPIGTDGLTISSLDKTEYDSDGRVLFRSAKGDTHILCPSMRDEHPSQVVDSTGDRYINLDWTYDTKNVNTLYGQALAKLKSVYMPAITYEVDGFFDLDIGDTVKIQDSGFTPLLLLEARVSEQEISFSKPDSNKTTFANFRALENRLSAGLQDRLEALIQQSIPYTADILTSNGLIFKNGEGTTDLTARVSKGTEIVTSQMSIQWYKGDKALSTAETITVNAESISGKAVYRFEATDSKGNLRGSCEVTVANVNDGQNGKPGENGKPGADAYTLYLSTISSVFNADFDGNLPKNISVSTAVVAFKGTIQLTPAIGTLPEVSGFAFSLSGSTITITGKKGGDMADNGVINIPVIVDGIACTLAFTYAKVKDGYHGEDAKLCTVTGNQIMKYASGSTTPVPENLTLTATYQNANHSRWQFLNEYGIWSDFTPSETKTSITVTADSPTWVGNTATVKAVDITGMATDTTTLAKLKDGEQGKPGKPGADVTAVDVEYYLSISATALTGGAWQTTAPTWVNGKYIWTRTKTTLSDGKETLTDPVNITGSKGQTGGTGTGVASITEEYYLSTSKTAQTGGNWSEKPPAWSSGKYVWTRSKIVYKDPASTSYTVPVCDSSWEAVNDVQIGGRNLIIGSSDATVGPQWSLSGWKGTFDTFNAKERTYKLYALNGWRSANYQLSEEYNGKQVTVSLMAKLDSEGTTATQNNSLYVNTPTTTTNLKATRFLKEDGTPIEDFPEKDKWMPLHVTVTVNNLFRIGIVTFNAPDGKGMQTTWLIKDLKVEKGNKATDWTPAPEDIQQQIDGTVVDVDVEYYLSTSATALSGGSWQTSAPVWVEGKYIWTRTKKTYGDSSIGYTNPTCITGATGKGIRGIAEQYYLSTSATALTGGAWQATVPAWANGKYMWTRSEITYTDKSTETTSPICVSGGKGDSGNDGTGYTILLSNEAYTFAGGTSSALAGSTSTNVTAYKNTVQIAPTVTQIGTTAVSGNPSGIASGFTGLTATVTGNGTTACKVTFAATTALTVKNGSVPISVTVDNRTFVKDFSFSLALKGETGSTGDKGDPTGVVESATEPSVKYVGMLWKNTGVSGSYIKDSIYRWSGAVWELFQFSAQNINAETFTGYEFDGSVFKSDFIRPRGIHNRHVGTLTMSGGTLNLGFDQQSNASTPDWVKVSSGQTEYSSEGVMFVEYNLDGSVRSLQIIDPGIVDRVDKLNNKFTSGKTGLISVNGGSYTDTEVSFGKDLGSTPLVFLTFNAGSANTKYLGLAYFNESSTGMTVRVSNSGGSRYSAYVTWLAIL